MIPTSLLAYPHNSVGDPEIASLVRMIDLAAIRGPVKANCLPRSLAIWWLLRRRGLQPDLRLGVRPQNNGIQAHAWVEYKGRVLNDEPGIGLHFAAFEKLRSEQGRKET